MPPASPAASAAMPAASAPPPELPVPSAAATLAPPAADRHRLAQPLVLSGIVIGSLHDDRLARQPHLAALVDVDDLDRHLVAFLHEVGDLAHPVGSELADVHQAVSAGHDLDEGSVGLDLPHGAGVELADLRHLGEALDRLHGAARRR